MARMASCGHAVRALHALEPQRRTPQQAGGPPPNRLAIFIAPRSGYCSCSSRRAPASRCCCALRWRAAAARGFSTSFGSTRLWGRKTGGPMQRSCTGVLRRSICTRCDPVAGDGPSQWRAAAGQGSCGNRWPHSQPTAQAASAPVPRPCRPHSLISPPRRVFERGGARVVTDAVSLEFLKGAVIEFEDSLMRSAFQVSDWVGL
jgi:hypothetical protein